MRRSIWPLPPNPDDYQYKNNPLSYNRAIYDWMLRVKSITEQNSGINDTPIDQNFVLGSYALTTTISNTATSTAIANFILTMVNGFIKKGIIAQTVDEGGHP